MAQPSFNQVILCTDAGRYEAASAKLKMSVDAISGISGVFVQAGGVGERQIRAEGIIKVSAASAAGARDGLLTEIRQRCDLADGKTIATFTGTDSVDYPQCLLLRYSHDDIQVSQSGQSFTAFAKVSCELMQVSP